MPNRANNLVEMVRYELGQPGACGRAGRTRNPAAFHELGANERFTRASCTLTPLANDAAGAATPGSSKLMYVVARRYCCIVRFILRSVTNDNGYYLIVRR